ncbi:hypothetical protein IFM89_023085 [Coptis chinensis]|uniref:Uncharacterized protein n=1 Tax=Coptis chinensis TaxID=261450 RepID=A0A835IEH6_9MAGN|nr:hypothetical protein IFM89_023085 [Coptis chinensis]
MGWFMSFGGNSSDLFELESTDVLDPIKGSWQPIASMGVNMASYDAAVHNVTSNSFVGGIPSNISLCSNLKNLFLDRNNMVGKIPVELGSLSKLVKLRLDSNMLTGRITPSLGNLTSLEILLLSKNSLGGSIPSILDQLKSLKILSLTSNKLYGIFPPSLFNLSSLEREKVIAIKKGDAIALPFGVVTWWCNKDDAKLVVLFLGTTSKADKAGEFTDFFLTRTNSIFKSRPPQLAVSHSQDSSACTIQSFIQE